MSKPTEGRVIGNLYFHVNNGGMDFSVRDMGFGPTLRLEYGHFGSHRSSLDIDVTKESLRYLRSMCFKAAAEEETLIEEDAPSARVREASVIFGSRSLKLTNGPSDLEFGFEHNERFGFFVKANGRRNFHSFMECDQSSFMELAMLFEDAAMEDFSPSPDHAFRPGPDTQDPGTLSKSMIMDIIQNVMLERAS